MTRPTYDGQRKLSNGSSIQRVVAQKIQSEWGVFLGARGVVFGGWGRGYRDRDCGLGAEASGIAHHIRKAILAGEAGVRNVCQRLVGIEGDGAVGWLSDIADGERSVLRARVVVQNAEDRLCSLTDRSRIVAGEGQIAPPCGRRIYRGLIGQGPWAALQRRIGVLEQTREIIFRLAVEEIALAVPAQPAPLDGDEDALVHRLAADGEAHPQFALFGPGDDRWEFNDSDEAGGQAIGRLMEGEVAYGPLFGPQRAARGRDAGGGA